MWKIGTLFIGLGSAIMALNAWPAASAYLVSVFGLGAEGILLPVGGIVVCLGIIAILVTTLRWVFNKVIIRFFSSIGEYIDPVFMAKPASSNELGQIFRLGSDLFEGGVSSINQMKRWHRVNPINGVRYNFSALFSRALYESSVIASMVKYIHD